MAIVETEHTKDCAVHAAVHQAMRAIRSDTMLARLSALPDTELAEWCTTAELGQRMWVAGEDSAAVNRIYYEIGRVGAAHGFPLPELIRALIVVLNLTRTEACPDMPAFVLPGLPDPLATFADYARYYLIRGYQDALR